MSQEPELLPCPFCGEMAEIVPSESAEGSIKARCIDCLACVYGEAEEEVAELWNARHRAIPEAKPDPRPKLRECWVLFGDEDEFDSKSYPVDVAEAHAGDQAEGYTLMREVTPNPNEKEPRDG